MARKIKRRMVKNNSNPEPESRLISKGLIFGDIDLSE
jgi:hypothetical protein